VAGWHYVAYEAGSRRSDYRTDSFSLPENRSTVCSIRGIAITLEIESYDAASDRGSAESNFRSRWKTIVVEETDHVLDLRICQPKGLSGLLSIGDFPSVIEEWGSHCVSTFPGECVMFRRELGNPDDPNASAILDTSGRKLGYLLREQSAELAPLMDHRSVILTGRLVSPGEAGYSKKLAQTRPQLIVTMLVVVPPGYTFPAETPVTSESPQTILDLPT
jgi:hypothetical protein